jgi:hypothetical protein
MTGEMNVYLSISGFTIVLQFDPPERIEKRNSMLSFIHKYYSGFMLPKKTTFDLKLRIAEIKGIPYVQQRNNAYAKYFRKISANEYETYYHVGPYEFSQLLQIMIMRSLQSDGLVLHASALQTKKGAYIFPGPSGTGKSTILRALAPFGKILADDNIIIKATKKGVMCFQSAYIERETVPIQKNSTPCTVVGIYAIKKNGRFFTQKLSTDETIKLLLTSIWSDAVVTTHDLSSINRLVKMKTRFAVVSWDIKDPKKVVSLLD